MKWTEEITELKRLQEADDPTLQQACDQAMNHADSWDCCSLAEKMKLIHSDWSEISGYDQGLILHKYADLRKLGADFPDLIDSGDFDAALEMHKKIQDYSVDEEFIHQHIDGSRKLYEKVE